MKSTERLVAVLPCNDHKIFYDVDGLIEERIGIAYIENDLSYGTIETRFINEQGYMSKLYCENEFQAIIGNIGDTVTLRDLSKALELSEDPMITIESAQKYFTLNLDGLSDTVKIYFKVDISIDNHAYISTREDSFLALSSPLFDLTDIDYCAKKETCTQAQRLDWYLIPMLQAYCKLIGKRPNLEIYFCKPTSGFIDEEEREKRMEKVKRYEEMYLPRLRRYINGRLDEELDKEELELNREEGYMANEARLEESLKTEYDLNPNLM